MGLKALFIVKNDYKLTSQPLCDLFRTVACVWRLYSFIVTLLVLDLQDLSLNRIVVTVYLNLLVKAHHFLTVYLELNH